MTPEALRRRMAHGNIYAADKVDAALGNYFRVGNLVGAARAGAAVGGRQGRRRPPGLHGGPGHRGPVGDPRACGRGGDRRAERRVPHPARGPHGPAGQGRPARACTCRPPTGWPTSPPDLLDAHRRLLADLGGEYHEVIGGEVAARADPVRPGRERHPARARRHPPQPLGRADPRLGHQRRAARGRRRIDVHVISDERRRRRRRPGRRARVAGAAPSPAPPVGPSPDGRRPARRSSGIPLLTAGAGPAAQPRQPVHRHAAVPGARPGRGRDRWAVAGAAWRPWSPRWRSTGTSPSRSTPSPSPRARTSSRSATFLVVAARS